METAQKWYNTLIFKLLLIFTLCYLLLFIRVLRRIGDEGTLVYGAQLVAEGALPYRDFFETMGPGSFYWLGLFFKLFGTNVLVARSVLLFTGTLTIVLLYWMTQRVLKGPLAILPSIFFLVIGIPLWSGANHHWDSNLFALLASCIFFLWQERGRKMFLVLSGMLAGLTSCFIQQKGLFIILAFALVVWCNGYRCGQRKLKIASYIGILLASYIGFGALILLFFFCSGGLDDIIFANLIWPIFNYSIVNIVPYGFGLLELHTPNIYFQLNKAAGTIAIVPLVVIYILPFLLLGFTVIACLFRATRVKIFNNNLLPYWVIGCALWISELHRRDIIHLIYGSPLLLILLFILWNDCLNNKRIIKLMGISIVSVCVIFFGSYNAIIAASANKKIVSRRGVLYGFKDDPALKYMIENTVPDEYVFVYPYYPMYYFLAQVRNPTRYSVLIGHYNTDTQYEEVIEDLKNKCVKYIFWDTLVSGVNLKTWFPQYKHTSKGNHLLEQYFEEYYTMVGLENGFKILQRLKDDTCN